MLKSQGFPKINRILQKNEYDSIMFNATPIRRDGVLIFFKSSNNVYARLGISVPKRVVGSAVDRNAIKRFIRESFRVRKLLLSNLDLVVLINQKRSIRALKNELQEGFNYLQEYCQKKRSKDSNTALPVSTLVSIAY